ncbi:MAG TPA: biotin/lipoyl-binding protein [Spirochaetota bacterium]|nr:biotin/lipoyl-binding protein [Spirochaetota bacterium]HPJ34227.1 biotin/lipoyl-binding protein [Spirochaetota bacterium]
MEIKSKMQGKVLSVKVAEGAAVKKGEIIIEIEAMKMKNPLPSPLDGTVKEIKVKDGDRISAGQLMMVIE